MQVRPVREEERERWDEFVLSFPRPSHSHLFAWKSVLEGVYKLKTCYLLAESGGEITAILPLVLIKGIRGRRFGISIPFTNRGGILFRGKDAKELLLREAKKLFYSFSTSYIEFRQDEEIFDLLPKRLHKKRLVLTLEKDEEALWRSFSAKVRNQVRKAKKEGLSVRKGKEELLAGFYRVFSENMRDLGTPTHSIKFFRTILKNFEEDYSIFVVQKGDKVIGGAFFCHFGDVVEVPWASSLRRWWHLCPNMLLYWEMMKEAIRCGASIFDFGRSTHGDGTYRFKLQWGAEPRPLFWYYLSQGVDFPGLDRGDRNMAVLIRLWKRLPLPIANLFGSRIIRRLPG